MKAINPETLEYRKAVITNLIPKGKLRPIMLKEIMEKTGFARRDITDTMKVLRKELPICSSKYTTCGYWIGDKEDVRRTIERYQIELQGLQDTIDDMERIYNEME